jgi:hypothetical protein
VAKLLKKSKVEAIDGKPLIGLIWNTVYYKSHPKKGRSTQARGKVENLTTWPLFIF